jgi:hypothetical protein
MKSAEPVKGRANLLGIVSVVAPWAYKENYENIERTRNFISTQVSRDDPGLKTTISILDNIQIRLKSQSETSNKVITLNRWILLSFPSAEDMYRDTTEADDNRQRRLLVVRLASGWGFLSRYHAHRMLHVGHESRPFVADHAEAASSIYRPLRYFSPQRDWQRRELTSRQLHPLQVAFADTLNIHNEKLQSRTPLISSPP